LSDPQLQLERMRIADDNEDDNDDKKLNSRSVVLFDRCQFLNNRMTENVEYPTLLSNGPLDIVSSYADVTVNECLFKNNFHDFRRDYKVRTDILS
jgi:hypothetical protein